MRGRADVGRRHHLVDFFIPIPDRRGSYFHMGSVWIQVGEMNSHAFELWSFVVAPLPVTRLELSTSISYHSYRLCQFGSRLYSGVYFDWISVFLFVVVAIFLPIFFLFIFGLLSRADRIGTTFSVSLPLPPSSSSLLLFGRFIQIGGPLIPFTKKKALQTWQTGLIFPSFSSQWNPPVVIGASQIVFFFFILFSSYGIEFLFHPNFECGAIQSRLPSSRFLLHPPPPLTLVGVAHSPFVGGLINTKQKCEQKMKNNQKIGFFHLDMTTTQRRESQ